MKTLSGLDLGTSLLIGVMILGGIGVLGMSKGIGFMETL